MLITVLSLIVVLGVLVFVHEAGHFVAAKWAGIYVHRFSLGLGAPVRWLTFRRGETEYSISWLPLGGYVKMASREEEATSAALEGDTPAVEVPADRVFEAKPVWKRMIVILAGVTMNFLFAYLVYAGLAYKHGRQIETETRVGRVTQALVPAGAESLATLRAGDRIVAVNGAPVASWTAIGDAMRNAGGRELVLTLDGGREVRLDVHADALRERLMAAEAIQPYLPAVVATVVADRPAGRDGLTPGDSIVAIDGTPVSQWYDLTHLIEAKPGAPVTLDVARAGNPVSIATRTYADTLPKDSTGSRKVVGRLGITPRIAVQSERYSLGGALGAGWDQTVESCRQIVRTVRGLFSGRVAGRELGGPILIGQLAGQSARLGLDTFLAFMALISVNLAVLNLLPIPVLDGGQFVFLVAEAVLRRPLPLKIRERLTAVGMVLILLLMVFAFSNDIRRVLGF